MLFLVWAIPFFVGMIIGRAWIGLGVWGGLALLFFGYVEQLLLCRHCPHYAEPGFFLRCHANWGLPKIPRFSPRPMSRLEGAIWLLYGALLFLYYVPFFVISQQWLLLGITTAALIVAVWTVRRTRCTRCYHLSCPANRLPEDVRAVFLKNYPRVLQIVCAGGPLALDDDTGLAQHGQVLGEAGPEERGAYQGKRVIGQDGVGLNDVRVL
jgi:hypothetical protein